LQHTPRDVALAHKNFLVFLATTETIENSHVPKRQLYAYAANQSSLNNSITYRRSEVRTVGTE